MRLNINLASQPYEVAREYTRRMTILIAALAVVAIAPGRLHSLSARAFAQYQSAIG